MLRSMQFKTIPIIVTKRISINVFDILRSTKVNKIL